MLISEFIDRVSRRLRDVDKRQWTLEYLVEATDAAFNALTHVLPQSYTVSRDIELVEGVRQTLEDDLHRIIHLICNVCPTTGQEMRTVTLTDLSVMDRQFPHWRRDKTRGYIWHYMNNSLDESEFYVWPPASSARGPEPVIPDVPVDPGPVSPDVVTTLDDTTPIHGNVGSAALTNGDLTMTAQASPLVRTVFSATPNATLITSGKFIWQVQIDVTTVGFSGSTRVGAVDLVGASGTNGLGSQQGGVGFTSEGFIRYVDATNTAQNITGGDTYAAGDIITVRLDMDTKTMDFAVNNGTPLAIDLTTVGSFGIPVNNDTWTPGFQANSSGQLTAVFDQATIEANLGTTLPTGFSVFDAPGVTQAEVDAYNALLAAYNAAVAANAAWQLLPAGLLVRGVFSATPCIKYPAPVDPGALNPPDVTQQDIDDYQADLAVFNAKPGFTIDEEIPFDKAHIQPLIEFATYYCHIRDDEQTANSGRAMQHWQNFFQLLNKREDSELTVKTGEQESEL